MRVTELFYSLQGEGLLVGTPSVFIRLAGCPLRCRWCDTPYAWDYESGDEFDVENLVGQAQQFDCGHIVITGGEPLVGPDGDVRAGLAELTGRLSALGKHITIETAGLLFVPSLACDLMSISPKLGNAHAAEHERPCNDPAALGRLVRAYTCQLKFVIESEDDLAEVQEAIARLGPIESDRVLLMPQARSREEMAERSRVVAELCLRTGFRFGPRLQTTLWGNQRGR